jgi:hypothetical protein
VSLQLCHRALRVLGQGVLHEAKPLVPHVAAMPLDQKGLAYGPHIREQLLQLVIGHFVADVPHKEGAGVAVCAARDEIGG